MQTPPQPPTPLKSIQANSEGIRYEEYMDDQDDGPSPLSIHNESVDSGPVYSLHSFAATVDVATASFCHLTDDSKSYWWLVYVLKTQEVGYIHTV